jgi:tRNA threonylcarbamoyladenosine biosynthesis protein TsaB
MRVLALDTTTTYGSVAVVADDLVLGELRLRVHDAHSIHLVPAVDFLLGQLGLKLAELDGLAIAVGPGSFTGLRVGLGTAQGLSLGADRPVVGVTTLEALAAQALWAAPAIVSLMDGYSSGVYAGYFDAELRETAKARLGSIEAVLGGVRAGTAFVGEPAQRARATIEACCPGALFPPHDLFLATAIGRLAAPRLAAGGGVTAEGLRPVYLREAQIGRPGGPPPSR